jgi:tetratricopeptide (TPR) repeat protein
MYNTTMRLILISLFFSAAPAGAAAGSSATVDTAAITEPDRGNFDGEVSDAAADMLEGLAQMRRNKFFKELNRLIKKGDLKKAEDLLKKREKAVPDQKNDEAYSMAKSKIAYAKGDYQSAYAAIDGLMARIEKHFAPRKPYEMDFKNKEQRDTLSSVYILRFQALSRMGRHEQALADLSSAQQLGSESPELFLSKASTLLWLGRYGEAAEAADKSYALNKDTFAASPYRRTFCDTFSSKGYQTKACAGKTYSPPYRPGEEAAIR